MDKPEFGRIIWGDFVDPRGRLAGPHRAVIITKNDDIDAGKPIRVRFTWSNTNSATPRWEQAFSSDGGKTWETNWIMDFRRPA